MVRVGGVDAIVRIETFGRARSQGLVAQSHGALAIVLAIPLGETADIGKRPSPDRDGIFATADDLRTAATGAEGENDQK